MKAFDVYLHGKKIDTVFCNERTGGGALTKDDDVRRDLIDHDGYDARIIVLKSHAPLKIYGGCFDGTWDLRVAATSWKAAVERMGNMSVSYAKRHGQAWAPRPEDDFLLDRAGIVYRAKATEYPKKWEAVMVKVPPEGDTFQRAAAYEERQRAKALKIDPTNRLIINLIGNIVGKIRIQFGVIPGMTPTKAIEISDAVSSLILEHLSHLHDVRAITDENGHLRIRPT